MAVTNSEAHSAERISFVTDVEGDWECWNRFIGLSRVLSRADDGHIQLSEGAHFVFGGDAQDRQSGDLEILRELLDLKKRYPDRVHLVMGNRDINKLRLVVELSEHHAAAMPLAEHPGPYWCRQNRPALKLSEEELSSNSMAARLRWILRDTMGAPHAFEFRREELKREAADGAVTDDDVVDSFAASVLPGGLVFEYLRSADLVVKINNVLFVHAGLPRSAERWEPGWLPGPPPQTGVPLEEWLLELKRLSERSLEEVATAADCGSLCTDAWSISGGYLHSQPGSALLQYGMRDMPDDSRQPSVVYNGWLGDDYQPLEPDEETVSWLRRGGIKRVVSGHLPHGEAPLVLRPSEDLACIACDCCYAGVVARFGDTEPEEERGNERALAVSEVLLEASGSTQITGILADGTAYESHLDDPAIGCLTEDGWRVKGRVGMQLLLSRNSRWHFETRLAAESDVRLRCMPQNSKA